MADTDEDKELSAVPLLENSFVTFCTPLNGIVPLLMDSTRIRNILVEFFSFAILAENSWS
jgi:hypothetical protein